jgi:hypothetical protein
MTDFSFQLLKNGLYDTVNKLHFVVVSVESVALSSEPSFHDERLQVLGLHLSVHLPNRLFKDPPYSFDVARVKQVPLVLVDVDNICQSHPFEVYRLVHRMRITMNNSVRFHNRVKNLCDVLSIRFVHHIKPKWSSSLFYSSKDPHLPLSHRFRLEGVKPLMGKKALVDLDCFL